MSIVYDVESYPNFFSLSAVSLDRDDMFTWEISERINDLESLYQWLTHLSINKTDMIGFNNVNYDYQLIHLILSSPSEASYQNLYRKTHQIINALQPPMIWESERFIPQIDLYKIHHFDNEARRCSLKQLQVNMRSESVEDLPFAPGTILTPAQMDVTLQYNRHDVEETKKFAKLSSEQIRFRRELMEKIDGDVLNFNDTKIGKQYFIQQLGDDACYSRISGRREPRQTPRPSINLGEIIFPYIRYGTSEFNRVLTWLKSQTISATKGVFTDINANINGFEFVFGVGGIHGSVEKRRYIADKYHSIIDIDVTSLYPSIAIVNRLYPEHLGPRFVDIYSDMKKQRTGFKKGTPENAMLKLALNGVYGDSNNPYSPFYDPQYTMTITINGQLLLCMLAEWLMTIPTLEIIQINTDGVTMYVNKSFEWMVKNICDQWQKYTMLELDEARYSRMWVRDVNNYLAEYEGGKKTKAKGAYAYPETIKDYDGWWHKDYSEIVVQRAAVAHMLHGVQIGDFIHMHGDPFDFMLRAKVDRSSKLFIGDKQVQRITRYYVAKIGAPMKKVSPPPEGAIIGNFKRKNGVSAYEYETIMSQIPPGTWDERIHTKNRSKYEDRETSIQAGLNVVECNQASAFDWSNLNYNHYIEQARKLIV